MYLTEVSRFPSFSPFGIAKKRCVPKNFDLVSRSFDENLLRCLKTLRPGSDLPSISLDWLSRAVDFLSSTQLEAQALITDLKLSGVDDSLSWYLDYSVKLLDVCNSITSEIERLRQRRLLMNFILHLLEFPEDGALPASEKLQRARSSLTDWDNCTGGVAKRVFQNNIENLIRDLAIGLGKAPNRKLSTAAKLVRRTIYAVGSVMVFVAGVVQAALYGSVEVVQIRVPAEYMWAEAFNDLESAICGELKRRVGGQRKHLFDELDDMGTRVRGVCNAIDGLEGEDKGEKGKTIRNAVKELKTAIEAFSEGLDTLSNGVNNLFHTILCTRNGMLENFRLANEKQLK